MRDFGIKTTTGFKDSSAWTKIGPPLGKLSDSSLALNAVVRERRFVGMRNEVVVPPYLVS